MFHKETEYALRSLVYIQAQNIKNRRPIVSEIAQEIGAPPFYIAKILQRLAKDGFVNSSKGRGGGFYFDEKKLEIPIRDIILSSQGWDLLTGCGFGLNDCDPDNPCPFHEQFSPIRNALVDLVSKETIKSLAAK